MSRLLSNLGGAQEHHSLSGMSSGNQALVKDKLSNIALLLLFEAYLKYFFLPLMFKTFPTRHKASNCFFCDSNDFNLAVVGFTLTTHTHTQIDVLPCAH